MSIATINGTTLYVKEVGSGPVCLVLHGGLGLDHSLYRSFDRLADRLRVVYYDHRGNGRSGRPPLETLTMPQLADDAAALADHLGADRVHVIGHSYGGFIGQELAIRHPDRVRSLVLISTAPGGPGAGEGPDDLGPPVPADLAAALGSAPATAADMADTMRPVLHHYLHRYPVAELDRQLRQVVTDAAAMTRSMALLGTWSAADRLAGISAPTLVLAGRYDVLTPPAQARRITRRIPDAHLVELADSAHFPWLDQPHEFFTVLDAWFAEHAAAEVSVPARVVAAGTGRPRPAGSSGARDVTDRSLGGRHAGRTRS
jgi:proline iminopeptidase